jgi:(2Fe-2S) ferredoxin
MAKPDFHIFVCAQRRPPGHPRSCCAEKGSDGLMDAFAKELISRNLQNKVGLTQTGCLGPCQAGANVLIYPGSYMYGWIAPADAAQIIEQHILEGKPITERLAPAELW